MNIFIQMLNLTKEFGETNLPGSLSLNSNFYQKQFDTNKYKTKFNYRYYL